MSTEEQNRESKQKHFKLFATDYQPTRETTRPSPSADGNSSEFGLQLNQDLTRSIFSSLILLSFFEDTFPEERPGREAPLTKSQEQLLSTEELGNNVDGE